MPYPDDAFDLVYSWGVIHHTPDTRRALEEIVRVCRPGGTCKIMVYNRHSLVTFFLWLRYALLAGRPWRSFSWCLHHHMESAGTKAYTKKELRTLLGGLPVENIRLKPVLTHYDRLGKFARPLQWVARSLAYGLGGDRVGWFMTLEFDKRSQVPSTSGVAS